MKKVITLTVLVGGVILAVRRNKAAKAEADLWREATAPSPRTAG